MTNSFILYRKPSHTYSRNSFSTNLESGVEVNGGSGDGVDHVRIVAGEHLVDHKGKNSHLGGTAVVELNGTLLGLGLLVEGVPAEVDESIAEVTRELSLTGNILHDSKLQESNEEEDLGKSTSRDLAEGSDTSGDGVEAGSRVVNVSGKTNSGGGNDVSKDSQLGDTAVLELDVTEAVEALLIGIIEHTKRIEESKRRLGTEGILEGLEGGLGGGLGNRGESGGRGDEGGGDGSLHVGVM